MKKLLILNIAVIILSLQSKANWCFQSFEEDTASANIIFIGKVDTNYFDQFWQEGSPRKITNFIVLDVYKGDVPYYISILGSLSSSNIKYLTDSTYLVFARHIENRIVFHFLPKTCQSDSLIKEISRKDVKGIYWTDDCSHTELLSKCGDLLKILGKPQPNRPKPNIYVQEMLMRNNKNNSTSIDITKQIHLEEKLSFYKIAFYVSILILLLTILYIIKIKKAV